MLVTVAAGTAQGLSPLVADWDQFFTIQSQSGTRGGRSMGIVWNRSNWSANRIQLLVEALDPAGQAIDQRVVWLGSDLAAGAYAYFDAPMPASASFRVRVFAFNLETTAGPR